MRRAMLAAALIVLAISAAPTAGTKAAEPQMNTTFASTFPDVHLQEHDFNLSQAILEFEPGAVFPLQTTTVLMDAFFTVIEGEVSVTVGSMTQVYGTGESAVIPSWTNRGFSNAGRSTPAKMFFTMITPDGVAPAFALASGVAMPALTPTMTNFAMAEGLYTDVLTVTVLQTVIDWDAGAKSPLHVMNHPHVISVAEGENVVRYQDGTEETYGAGQQFVMTVGRPGTMENPGSANNRTPISWVLVSDAPPFSPIDDHAAAGHAIGAPSAGDAGLADTGSGSAAGAYQLLFVAVVGGAILLTTWRLARRRSKSSRR